MSDPTQVREDFVAMLADKVREAKANGATEEQAIAAVRALWLEAIQPEDEECRECGSDNTQREDAGTLCIDCGYLYRIVR